MIDFDAPNPFVQFCGLEMLGVEGERALVRLALQPQHYNRLGIVHGGVICLLLDVAMGAAANRIAKMAVVTLDMSTSFLRPGRGTLMASGRVVRAGRSVVFCEAEITGEAGEIVARATGTMAVVRKKAGVPVAGSADA